MPPDEAPATDAVADPATVPDSQSKGLLVGLLIIALLLALILIQLRPQLPPNNVATPATSDSLQAAIDIERAALNRELAALNLPPLTEPQQPSPAPATTRRETPDKVAQRIAADSRTLIAHATDLQRLLNTKDDEIAAATREVLQAQKQLLAMSKQLSALKQQNASSLTGAESQTLQRGAEIAAARTAAVEKSLAEANVRLADYANAPSAAEHANLQSLYQDALRARDFFENHAAELEKKLTPGPADSTGPGAATDPELPQL